MIDDIKLPCWLSGPNAQAIKSLAMNWWAEVEGYIRLPLTTFDVMSCELTFVDLIAFQRGIDRYAGENEGFYRLRVFHALRNAKAAGTPAGMTKIFSNMGFPKPEFFERLPAYDWDMTKVRVPSRDYAMGTLRAQINFILTAYWQTCRRFIVAQKTESVTWYGPANVMTNRNAPAATLFPNTLNARSTNNILFSGNAMTKRSHTARTVIPAPLVFDGGESLLFSANTLTKRQHSNRIFKP